MERKFVVYEKSTEYVCSNRASKLPEKCQTASYSYVYQQFTNKGFHYISRPDKFWAGLWSDLVIEQIMIGSLKSLGGLARGQGMDRTQEICGLQLYTAVLKLKRGCAGEPL